MSDVKHKAKMLLAGLAVMPALAAAQPGAVQPSGYHSPYNDEDQGDLQDGQLSVGLDCPWRNCARRASW